ncbi:MAG TPA: hypothetical protein VGL65_11385 [Gemmatimonadales bacterium]|jgi:hypothetical protein
MSSNRIFPGLACFAALLVAACSSTTPGNTGVPAGPFANNPCAPDGTINLDVAHGVLLDCSNGGSTVSLAGNGASYVVVAQFATNLVANQDIPYTLETGTLATASLSAQRVAARRSADASAVLQHGTLPPRRPMANQDAFERAVITHAASANYPRLSSHPTAHEITPPTLGSTRTFRVLSNFDANTFSTATAQLAYIGSNIYLYIDVNAPANGFTPAQLSAFGQLFDQTLYDIDVNAFGQPSDVDANGHIIMLMSPLVNADTPASTCATEGFVAGFFDSEDFDGPGDPNSNQGEVFYSVVPDPNSTFSCAHTVSDVGSTLPATFLHELQHLINYSQHVVVNNQAPLSSWLDEGMSIAAEELGSLYYEQKCPPPACRTDPTQIFPDSSQGFIQGFFYDSYFYALLPDSVSLTLHNDSENGFSWRGGDWALVRYLVDRFGTPVYRSLETGPSDGLAAIAAATGQGFRQSFGDFGMALYTDSFPGLPRTTAPPADRFVTRNLRQLWARLFATAGPSTSFPSVMPLALFAIHADTTTFVMEPGAMSFWRVDTSPSDTTVAIRFAGPGGNPLSSALAPQLSIFRLPPGQ